MKMMYLVFFLLTVLAGTLGTPRDSILQGERIVNGSNADPGEYPFMASFQYLNSHMCGGTIWNKCFMVTAAHCVDFFYRIGLDQLSILVGTNSLSSGGTRYQIMGYRMHEDYDPLDTYINDIAVVKIIGNFNFSSLVELGKYPAQGESTPGDTPATVIGWGDPYTGGAAMNDLQEVDIGVYSDEDCQTIHHNSNIHNTNICAGVPEGGKGQCTGDSGGPLLANGHQVGIVSWSVKPCTIAPYPGVYTEVAQYIDWIKNNTNNCS